MGTLLRKILCPNPEHKESNPSCGVYDDGTAYCFSCQMYFPDYEQPGLSQPIIKVKENLDAKLLYISELPTVLHRGLCFPYDNMGYYCVWPDKSYYKLRIWDMLSPRTKYVNPSGHAQPWFTYLRSIPSRTLIITEGEINAMSIHEVFPELDVISPGGAGMFFNNYTKTRLQTLPYYHRIVIIADEDIAGFEAAIKLKEILKEQCQDIAIELLDRDCNTILIENGKEGLKRAISSMGV